MEKKKYDEEYLLDIGGLIKMFWHYAILILGVGFICACITYTATKTFVTPQYTAQTKLYVINKETTGLSASDFAMATYLTADYSVILKTDPIAQETIDSLKLDMTTDELLGKVDVFAIDESRVMGISIKDTDPENAMILANAYREAAATYLKNVTGSDAVNTVEEAKLPVRPSSPNKKLAAVIGAFFGCLLVMFLLFIKFIANDTLTTAEDVEKYLEVSVFGMIPYDKNSSKIEKARRHK